MISSFVCAAYFVTVRVIDTYAMGVFNDIFPSESSALMASDLFVWVVPLLFFGIYWGIRDNLSKSLILLFNHKIKNEAFSKICVLTYLWQKSIQVNSCWNPFIVQSQGQRVNMLMKNQIKSLFIHRNQQF
jgi:hypothetical protein